MNEPKYIQVDDRTYIDLSPRKAVTRKHGIFNAENESRLKSDIKPGELQPRVELEKLTVVSDDDVNNAISEWKNDPPQEEYKTLLDADEVENE